LSDPSPSGDSGPRSIRFSFDDRSTVSPSLRLNQLGYAPGDRPKAAYLDRWLDGIGSMDWLSGSVDGRSQIRFEVRRVGDPGPPVFTAPVPAATSNAEPGDLPPPIELDFSSVDEAGRFQVCVPALGCSLPFDIGEDVWRRAAVTVARAAYHQRSGMELGPPFTAVNRPRGYHPDDGEAVEASTHTMAMARANPASDFDDLAAGGTGELVDNAWGGHFDAGDWDRRIDHLHYTRTVADLVRRYPATVTSWRLNIPESDDDVPDVLDEGLWSLDLYRRMQRSDGAIRGGIEASEHPMYGSTSWTDDLSVYAYEPDRWSSYLFASVAAEVAHTLGPYDRDRAEGYLQSALAAMEWAEAQDGVAGTDPSGEVESQRNVAAAALLLATGDEQWHRLFLETADYLEPGAQPAMACHVHTVCDAAWLYLEAAGELDSQDDATSAGIERTPTFEPDPVVVAELRGRFLASADELLRAADEHAYGWTTEHPDVPLIWGLGAGGAPKGAGLLKAYQLSGDERYRRAVLRSASVGLGANPLGQVFLTGIGHNPVRHPVIIDNLNGGIPLWPGTPVYGFHDLGWGPGDDWAVEYFLRPAGARPDPDKLPYLWQWYDLNSMPFFNEFTLHQSHAEALRVFATLDATRGKDSGG
jgi:endoglucanase